MEGEEQQLSSMSIIELIPHAKIKSQTMAYCEAGDSDCDNATSTGAAPLCESIRVGELWPSPTADLVSTWSDELAEENGVDDEPSWSCPAAPGRFIPVCMLAPCMYKNAGETNRTTPGCKTSRALALWSRRQSHITCTGVSGTPAAWCPPNRGPTSRPLAGRS